MELAILYDHLLRGLGFNAYTVGVRTRSRIDGVPGGIFPGWVHIVNIVTLPTGERYAVDVAFGGDGPTAPLPLESGLIHQNLGTQQYRNGADREWNSYYAFTEAEFMAADWGVINYWTSTSPDSHQTRTLLVVRFLGRTPEAGERVEEDDWEIYGKRMLVNGAIKENLGGKTRVLAECNTEAERVEALKQHFGITLKEEEISSIKGWATDLDSVV
ncbi:arylamine n-acetyltransferase 1 [Seiridium cupressi]